MPIAPAAFIEDFASALKTVDTAGKRHKNFQPGIGPFGETDALREALSVLQLSSPQRYSRAAIKHQPDLLIPNEWQLEFKLIRPFGDNGKPAEHWS
jgi:hypothetical protein